MIKGLLKNISRKKKKECVLVIYILYLCLELLFIVLFI